MLSIKCHSQLYTPITIPDVAFIKVKGMQSPNLAKL